MPLEAKLDRSQSEERSQSGWAADFVRDIYQNPQDHIPEIAAATAVVAAAAIIARKPGLVTGLFRGAETAAPTALRLAEGAAPTALRLAETAVPSAMRLAETAAPSAMRMAGATPPALRLVESTAPTAVRVAETAAAEKSLTTMAAPAADDLAARIDAIAQRQPGMYYDIIHDRTKNRCMNMTTELQQALHKEGIETLWVGSMDGVKTNHQYLLARKASGEFLTVDPSAGQFIPGMQKLFIGNRSELVEMMAKGNRAPAYMPWPERPLVQPPRFLPPSAEEARLFQQKWGGSGAVLYEDQLPAFTKYAAATPDFREVMPLYRLPKPNVGGYTRVIPDEFINRLEGHMRTIGRASA